MIYNVAYVETAAPFVWLVREVHETERNGLRGISARNIAVFRSEKPARAYAARLQQIAHASDGRSTDDASPAH